jgi:hypothetical protein
VTRAELLATFDTALVDPTAPYINTISVDPGVDLVMDSESPIRFGNHSCDPNMWHLDAFTLAACRDIASDEELTVDYATHTDNPDFSMDCNCGSNGCRGTVTGTDWRLTELQGRYGEHWVPALLVRIRSQKPATL